MDSTAQNSLQKERNYWLDNVKGILIIFVVLAHTIGILYDDCYEVRIVYNFINLFHMPAFIMISGYFSKRKVNEKDYAGVFKTLLLPYFLYYCVGVVISGVTGETLSFNLLSPTYGLWYILVLGIFIIITPMILDKIGKHIIWVSLVIMVLAYSLNLAIYGSLFRVFTYYPFFLCGYFLKSDTLGKFKDNKALKIISQLLSLIFFVFVYLLIVKVTEEIDIREALWHVNNIYGQYDEMNIDMNRVIYICIVSVVLAFLCSYAIILLSPRRKTFLSHVGQYSIYVFILHVQIVPIVRSLYNLYRRPFVEDFTVDAIILAVGAIIFSFLLCSKPVRKVTRPFVQPKFNLSFLRKLIDKES